MEPTPFMIHHLVKSEDLNHHQTLYAGRGAEWVVEAGFVAAANLLPPANIVCVKIHGLEFSRPVRAGEIACFQSKIVLAGRSRLVAFIKASVGEQEVVRGFITFVNVDAQGHSKPHGIVINPLSGEDKALNAEAQALH